MNATNLRQTRARAFRSNKGVRAILRLGRVDAYHLPYHYAINGGAGSQPGGCFASANNALRQLATWCRAIGAGITVVRNDWDKDARFRAPTDRRIVVEITDPAANAIDALLELQSIEATEDRRLLDGWERSQPRGDLTNLMRADHRHLATRVLVRAADGRRHLGILSMGELVLTLTYNRPRAYSPAELIMAGMSILPSDRSLPLAEAYGFEAAQEVAA